MSAFPRLGTAFAAGALVASLGAAVPAVAADNVRGQSPCRNGYVGLTFDDGPSANAPTLLKALTDNGLRATMFNQGNNALARPDFVRQEVQAGMWVGNHTYDHPNLPQIGEPQALQEIASTQDILRGITGDTPTLFRPPYGATSDQVREDEAQLGVLEVLWTVDSRDWAGASVDEIVAAVGTMKDGDIILMHDWPANTVTAIPRIAQVLQQNGLCSGEIAYTPRDISGVGTTFHAVAVKPRGNSVHEG